MLTFFVVFTIVGFSVSTAFGKSTNSIASLNWKDYIGYNVTDPNSPSGISLFIRFTILLFPAIDSMSSFPITALNLADNMQSIVTYTFIKESRVAKYGFRLLAALPPLFAAYLFPDTVNL